MKPQPSPSTRWVRKDLNLLSEFLSEFLVENKVLAIWVLHCTPSGYVQT